MLVAIFVGISLETFEGAPVRIGESASEGSADSMDSIVGKLVEPTEGVVVGAWEGGVVDSASRNARQIDVQLL